MGKGFFGVVVGAVAVVEDADAVPQAGFLGCQRKDIKIERRLPLDRAGGREPVGRQSKPVAGRPS